MRLTTLCFGLLLSASNAFVSPNIRQTRPEIRLSLMSLQDIEAIMASAQDCSEGECSVDQVGDLIQVLQTQQRELNERIQKIDTMVKSLDNMNGKEKDRDEVRETIRAIMRVFSKSDGHKASTSAQIRPTGYSGDVGKGPTDAYKALKPKPYKP